MVIVQSWTRLWLTFCGPNKAQNISETFCVEYLFSTNKSLIRFPTETDNISSSFRW